MGVGGAGGTAAGGKEQAEGAPPLPPAAPAAAALDARVLEQLAKGMALYGLTVHKVKYKHTMHIYIMHLHLYVN